MLITNKKSKINKNFKKINKNYILKKIQMCVCYYNSYYLLQSYN
jgi:hypothetical protein